MSADDLKLSPAGRRYGALLDQPDKRDLTLKAAPFPIPTAAQLATKVDLREFLGPVRDQSNLGACTAYTYAGMREFLYRRYYKYERNKVVAPADFIVSPKYLYYRELEKEQSLPRDSGAQMRTGPWVLNHFGACLETEDLYDTSEFAVAPSPEQTAEAYQLRGGAYHRIESFADMKSCLSDPFPFVFGLGMVVLESFETIGDDGRMPIPNKDKEQVLGGHAVLVCGFDDEFENLDGSLGAFLVRNSWSAQWGEQGYFHMPYSVAQDVEIVTDSWMQHLGGKWS